ncbi:hypothetical protein HT594_00034 [Phenacoccus solenopsis nudivirus]|nr:hypothetical protein HT594_00034 [Phenacoccus solenopsis nudivirus]
MSTQKTFDDIRNEWRKETENRIKEVAEKKRKMDSNKAFTEFLRSILRKKYPEDARFQDVVENERIREEEKRAQKEAEEKLAQEEAVKEVAEKKRKRESERDVQELIQSIINGNTDNNLTLEKAKQKRIQDEVENERIREEQKRAQKEAEEKLAQEEAENQRIKEEAEEEKIFESTLNTILECTNDVDERNRIMMLASKARVMKKEKNENLGDLLLRQLYALELSQQLSQRVLNAFKKNTQQLNNGKNSKKRKSNDADSWGSVQKLPKSDSTMIELYDARKRINQLEEDCKGNLYSLRNMEISYNLLIGKLKWKQLELDEKNEQIRDLKLRTDYSRTLDAQNFAPPLKKELLFVYDTITRIYIVVQKPHNAKYHIRKESDVFYMCHSYYVNLRTHPTTGLIPSDKGVLRYKEHGDAINVGYGVDLWASFCYNHRNDIVYGLYGLSVESCQYNTFLIMDEEMLRQKYETDANKPFKDWNECMSRAFVSGIGLIRERFAKFVADRVIDDVESKDDNDDGNTNLAEACIYESDYSDSVFDDDY